MEEKFMELLQESAKVQGDFRAIQGINGIYQKRGSFRASFLISRAAGLSRALQDAPLPGYPQRQIYYNMGNAQSVMKQGDKPYLPFFCSTAYFC